MSNSLYTILLIFISLYSSFAQQFEWAKAFTGYDLTRGKSMTVDGNGNVFTIGEFKGTVDFDYGVGTYNLISMGSKDIFILKLDTNGNFMWAKRIGGLYTDEAKSITIDNQYLYATGYFGQTTDFDPGPGTINLFGSGTFVLKMDTDGNSIWAKSMIGDYNIGQSICTDMDGNVLTTGWFFGTVDFDPGAGVYNLIDIVFGGKYKFTSKLDSNGKFLWAKGIGGFGIEESNSITTDLHGNVYTTGGFYGSVDFDPGVGIYTLTANNTVSNVKDDIFLLKLDSNGNFLWARSFGGGEGERGVSVKTDKYGNVYTTGDFSGIVDFDPGPGIYNLAPPPTIVSYIDNIFISKLDVNGDFIWALFIAGTWDYWRYTNSIFLDKFSNIYLTGFFDESGDFDPGADTFNLIVPDGVENAFVLKLSQCQVSVDSVQISSCHRYIWLDGKTYTESTDTAKYIIQNKAGCDSIITLNLTILKPDSTTIYQESCKNYEWKGSTFDQSGIYKYDTLNVEGCDSTVFLDLTIIKPDTLPAAHTACDSYLWHNDIYDQSGTYFFDTLSTHSCDSTVVLNLTINHSAITQLSQTSCDSLSWQGNTYTESGIYQYKTQTTAGCDSTITLNLKINKSDKIALIESACDNYTWNGNTYNQSGTYTYQTINSEGCDSTITLDLTITDHIERSDTINICEGDSISLFGNWISKEGEITETFTSVAGCDSIMTYKIKIDELPEGGIAAKICYGDSIFLYQQWFSQAGSYTVKKSNTAGCDSLININIAVLPVKTFRDTISVCRGDTLMPEGLIIAKDTDIQRLLTSAESCDSIVYIHVLMLEPALTQREIKLCPGDSILIGGNWVKTDGIIEENFTAHNGCDSTSISKILMIPEPEDPEYEIDCDTREVKVMIDASADWQILWDNGSDNYETTYKDKTEANVTLTSIPDCNRSFTIALPQIPDISLIKLPEDTTVIKNNPLVISLDIDTALWKILWSPIGMINCNTCKEVVITPSGNIDMKLQLTHESGCTYEVNFRIMLEKEEINVPNIFTPDGDGINDIWKVKIPSDIDLLRCRLFDRWGELIYSTGADIRWDGTFKSMKAGTGVYVYVIEYEESKGESKVISGDVTLLR